MPPCRQVAGSRGDGDIFESATAALAAFAAKLAALGAPVAALFIDYGHAQPGLGDTLQAVRAHRYDDPLRAPGEADLTAQVDFAAFADAMQAHGLACDGPVPQAEFLGRLGIVERASRLMAANPAKAGADRSRHRPPHGAERHGQHASRRSASASRDLPRFRRSPRWTAGAGAP